MEKKVIVGALAVGMAFGAIGISSLGDAQAQKRLVALVEVDAASLNSDYLELRKLPDAGVQAMCRGEVAKEGGGVTSLEPSTFEAEGADLSLFLNSLGVCDVKLKNSNPKLKE